MSDALLSLDIQNGSFPGRPSVAAVELALP